MDHLLLQNKEWQRQEIHINIFTDCNLSCQEHVSPTTPSLFKASHTLINKTSEVLNITTCRGKTKL